MQPVKCHCPGPITMPLCPTFEIVQSTMLASRRLSPWRKKKAKKTGKHSAKRLAMSQQEAITGLVYSKGHIESSHEASIEIYSDKCL